MIKCSVAGQVDGFVFVLFAHMVIFLLLVQSPFYS